MYNGLKEYVKFLEEKGELRRIKEFVDPVLEIACATDIESKKPGCGKALLFENTGTAFPVLTNLTGSEARVRYALGTSPQETGARLVEMIDTMLGRGRKWRDLWKMLQVTRRVASWKPRPHKGHAPCQDVVQYAAQLSQLPALKEWPQDTGRFLTLTHVHTCNPLTGKLYTGLFRMQLTDDTTAILHCPADSPIWGFLSDCTHRLPVIVCLGGDPVYSWIASTPLPEAVDPFLLAGFLRGKPVEMVKCFTQEMLIPADCDLVIEGYIQKSEEKVDALYPRFHASCISHRFDAICPANVPGALSSESKYEQEARESLVLPLVRHFHGPAAQDFPTQNPEPGRPGTGMHEEALSARMSELLKD